VHGFGYAFLAEVRDESAPAASDQDGRGTTPAASAFLTARLLWENRLIPLSPGENILGRDDEVHVRIDAPSVSRHHARIRVKAGEAATIEDLGSKNGTWVAERRLLDAPATLHDGEAIKLGKVELVYLEAKEKGSTQSVVE
jgi:pSer/pThr/pTyr-binding forkhead associated (FHA) protein